MPQDITEGFSATQNETIAAMIQAARMEGFRIAEQNREQAIAMGYQMALDRVAEMDAATRRRSQVRHEDWVAARVAEMEEVGRRMRASGEIKTPEWKGLDNGAQVPSSDWYGNDHEYVRKRTMWASEIAAEEAAAARAAATQPDTDYDGDGDG